MGLDIEFYENNPEAAQLDGQRLANVPAFMNLVRVLGELLEALKHDPADRTLYSTYQDCAAFVEKHPEAEERFQAYLNFIRKFAARVAEDGADLGVPLALEDYDPLARRLAAALMLRDDPITGSEAKEIVEWVSDLLNHSRAMARILTMLSDVEASAIESANNVLEKFKRCVELAAEKNISFKIDF